MIKNIIKIVLLGKPMSTNHLYGQVGKVRYMKSPGKQMKESYINQIKQQYAGDPLNGNVAIKVDVYRKGAQLDWDNVHKLSIDSLNGLVIMDDSQIRQATVQLIGKDNLNPRMEISVWKM